WTSVYVNTGKYDYSRKFGAASGISIDLRYPPGSTLSPSTAASDVYKIQVVNAYFLEYNELNRFSKPN
ncbi:hypothetical protein, partial [Virgibacillus doumboii]|uniref:hypothetical protein n=1 Tax=Virgibacillus doumboii TaxID=2697503 RepID=UPI00196819DB